MRKYCNYLEKCMAILLAMVLACAATGCGEFLDDEEYYGDESYEDSYDAEAADDDADYSSSDMDLSDDAQFPFGSCKMLDGKLVLVSIFANDATSSWDFANSEEDVNMLNRMATQTRIGCDWIEQQAAAYGRNVEIISDFNADNELYYQMTINADLDDNQYHIDETKGYIYMELGGVGEHLMEKYDADNICFAFYLNKPASSQMTSVAYEYLGQDMMMDLPYECVFYAAHVCGEEQGPAMYAHEILHCFGAPDLYMANTSIEPICISQEFSDYCRENYINEIMFSNYDVYNSCINNEAVTNELTDITAYYLGWIDYCEVCDQFGALDREDK